VRHDWGRTPGAMTPHPGTKNAPYAPNVPPGPARAFFRHRERAGIVGFLTTRTAAFLTLSRK